MPLPFPPTLSSDCATAGNFHAVNSLYTSCASSSHQLSKFEKINVCPPSPALVVDRAYQDRKTMLLFLWASGAIAGLQKSDLGCSVWLQKNVTAGKLVLTFHLADGCFPECYVKLLATGSDTTAAAIIE